MYGTDIAQGGTQSTKAQTLLKSTEFVTAILKDRPNTT